MKDINTILSHISSKPQFYKLKESKCISELKALLPSRISDLIKFAYVKNDTLFIAVPHSGAKMELNNDYNITLIKRVLKLLQKSDKSCEKYLKEKVKIFISTQKDAKIDNNSYKIYTQKEKSKGYFINQAKKKSLKNIFEKIRKAINSNRQRPTFPQQ